MSKVICDICGTEYPEFDDFCPNCGCSQDVSAEMDMELEDDNFLEDSPITAARKQKEAAAAEEQEKRAAAESAVYVDMVDEEDEDENQGRGVGLVIVLTVVVMLLLSSAAFVFLRFILPGMELGKLPELTEPVTQEQMESNSETEGIPCRMLVMTSGTSLDLTREGEFKLIHVMVKPEDTTDILTYTSSDESIVTVTEDGRLCAVSQGEATISITCGEQSLMCRVYVEFTEEPEPASEEPELPVQEQELPEEPELEETEPEESEPEETEEVEETVPETTATQLKDVTLKLGKSEFILPPGYIYTVPLDCDLTYEEIEWSIENPGVASVKNGVVSGLSYGVTTLTAKYGDQTATCIVRIKNI